MSSHSDATDFKVGDWWVRPQRNLIQRGDTTQPLEARSIAVLVCLGKYAPSVVSKERILEEVWDGAFVGDDAVTHAIWELRKALGDSARAPLYIQTVPKKGYRLIAEVLRPQGAPLPVEGARIDHYELGDVLGRGSMGVVFKATDRRLERPVAIKFLAERLTRDTKACLRFEREAQLAASLEHPNLGTVHEVGETSQGFRYLVTPFYGGGSLKDRLALGPLNVDEARRLMAQLIAGLGAAHRREIIHRDIKPANLMLDGHGTLKVCDFGIAKLLGATDLTDTGASLGTPAYKSPEQAAGAGVDHRTDLWAAAVVFYELLTGRRPFTGEGERAVTQAILSGSPDQLPFSASLVRFMEKALAKDPADRFQNADEMLTALEGTENDAAVQPPSPLSSWKKRVAVAGIAATALALAGSGIWQNLPDKEPVLSPREREGNEQLDQGRSLWLRGHHKRNEAEQRFRKAVELMPSSAEAVGHLAFFMAETASIRRQEEAADEAIVLVEEAYRLDPQSALARAAEAWLLLVDAKPKQAEKKAREAVNLYSDCKYPLSCDLGYMILGEILFTQNRIDESEAVLLAGTHRGGGPIRCRLKLAQHYNEQSLPFKMEQELKAVLEFEGDQSAALMEISNYYLQSGNFFLAEGFLDRLSSLDRDPRVLLSLGYAQYMNELWEGAIETYMKADRAFQKEEGARNPSPLMAIGDIYLERDMPEQAHEKYLVALDVYIAEGSQSIERRAQKAVCLAKLGRFDEAIKEIGPLVGDPELVDDFKELILYAGQIYALADDRPRLFKFAAKWQSLGGAPQRMTKEDVSFKKFRQDREYLRILFPPN